MLGWRGADPTSLRSPAAATTIADVPVPPDVEMDGALALSPDGTTIAFVGIQDGTPSLWRRRLDKRDARLLEGTMGAAMPFWSPDGRVLAYFAGGKLRRVPAEGGPSADICDVVGQPRGGTWSPSGAIVFAREGGAGLERVSSDGSNRRMLTTAADGERHEHPVASADGARVAFTVAKGGFRSGAAEAHVTSLDGQGARLLARDARRPTVTGAHLVFVRGRALLSRPVDAAAADASSERVLASDLADAGPERQPYGLSQGGALVYARQVAVAGLTRLTWLDRAGGVLRAVGEPGRWSNVELSPRGDRFVLTLVDPARDLPELWMLDALTDRLARLSVEPAGQGGRCGRRTENAFSTASRRLDPPRNRGSSRGRPAARRRHESWSTVRTTCFPTGGRRTAARCCMPAATAAPGRVASTSGRPPLRAVGLTCPLPRLASTRTGPHLPQ